MSARPARSDVVFRTIGRRSRIRTPAVKAPATITGADRRTGSALEVAAGARRRRAGPFVQAKEVGRRSPSRRQNSEFLANMSHESLRTPLNAHHWVFSQMIDGRDPRASRPSPATRQICARHPVPSSQHLLADHQRYPRRFRKIEGGERWRPWHEGRPVDFGRDRRLVVAASSRRGWRPQAINLTLDMATDLPKNFRG